MLKQKVYRNPYIDILRGLCVVMMVLDHFAFFIVRMYILWTSDAMVLSKLVDVCKSVLVSSWRKLARYVILFIFFFISGYCTNFSKRNVKRFIKLGGIALIISLITFILKRYTLLDIYIQFGVIHFYACAIFITYLINKIINNNIRMCLYLVLLFVSSVFWFWKPTLKNSNILAWLGIPSNNYSYSFDYIPIFPHISMFICGVLIGNLSFNSQKQQTNNLILKCLTPLSCIGKNSLVIYITHIPILILIIYVLSWC